MADGQCSTLASELIFTQESTQGDNRPIVPNRLLQFSHKDDPLWYPLLKQLPCSHKALNPAAMQVRILGYK